MKRKQFLQAAALTTVGAAAGTWTKAAGLDVEPVTFGDNLALASYTTRTLSLDDTIKIAARLGLKSIALKSMHLPLESTPEQIKTAADKVRAGGLNLYGAGVIYMKTPEEATNAFNYAKLAGMHTIIGVPNHELLPLVNDLVKQHNIRLAIHNHGPGDKLYRSPNDVWDKIKKLDERVGLCIDVGHVVRIGENPVPLLEKYKQRLYDIHIKDVNKAKEDGEPLEIGRGVIDIPSIMKTLRKIGYTNTIAIEYEKDGDDPIPGLAESVGYLRAAIRLS